MTFPTIVVGVIAICGANVFVMIVTAFSSMELSVEGILVYEGCCGCTSGGGCELCATFFLCFLISFALCFWCPAM